jgi:hypothetical protein
MEYDKDEKLPEATGQDSISFVPAHLGVVRAKIMNLAKEKPDWGVQVLEDEENKYLKIENRLEISVPHKHWDNFLTIFKDSKIDSDTLNLRVLLHEAENDNMKKLRRELKSSITKMFEGDVFKLIDNSINAWKSRFRTYSYKTGDNMPSVFQERKRKDVQAFYGRILKNIGEDRGSLEILINDVEKGRPLSFEDRDFLYGTIIETYHDETRLVFEAMIDKDSKVSESIFIGNEEVLAEAEEQMRIRRVESVIYPTGLTFSARDLRLLYDIVEDVATEDEEIEDEETEI